MMSRLEVPASAASDPPPVAATDVAAPAPLVWGTPLQPAGSPLSARCAITGVDLRAGEGVTFASVRAPLAERIKVDYPFLDPADLIDAAILGIYRARYVEEVLRRERGGITDIEQQVIDSLGDRHIATTDIESTITREDHWTGRLFDTVAAFGSSWALLGGLAAAGLLLVGAATSPRFGIYPLVLLSLVLAAVAALETPLILMGQRRQDERDRRRSQNVYRVSLRAELELRHLQEQLDHLAEAPRERPPMPAAGSGPHDEGEAPDTRSTA
ncbi:MAG TPA: DUF1003 domain-containing protein [Devosia sp.]|nr:DUF1003 domain-containing protein [Devosia sp.]